MALDYIYGYHPVINAIDEQSLIKVQKVFLVHDKHRELKTILMKNKIDFEIISLEKMNNLLKTTKHQNIAAAVKNYHYFTLEQLISLQPINKFARYLILDRIFDPHNFGSMLRIAAGNDFDGVIVWNRNQAEINGVVAKAAAGALSIIPICQVKNLTTTITKLKNEYNFWILAAAKNDIAVDYLDVKADSNLGLIIGNEGEGISTKLLNHSDFIVQIPMSNKIESFNASVACAIIANHIYLETLKLNTNVS